MSDVLTKKTIDDHFRDWESYVFGFGYGTGEEHTLAALKNFMGALGTEYSSTAYNYRTLEAALTPTVAWLMINILCDANIIEYGTSPRGGWLTPEGVKLKEYIAAKTVAELETICCGTDDPFDINDSNDHYVGCFPDGCNCGPGGYRAGNNPCGNPFFETRA